jgi:hypothetical protein
LSGVKQIALCSIPHFIRGSTFNPHSLISNVPNEYDASHPKKNEVESTNIYSEPVKELMKLVCAGLPLPYFALLHIADEILTNLKK